VAESIFMKIREFKEEDRNTIAQIYLKGRIETFNWSDTSIYTLEDFDTATIGECILVAEVGVILTGFIAFYKAESFIHHLYVSSDHHNKGIGKALLLAAVGNLDQPVRLKCLIRNEKSVSFYKSQGWKFEMMGIDLLGKYCVLVNS